MLLPIFVVIGGAFPFIVIAVVVAMVAKGRRDARQKTEDEERERKLYEQRDLDQLLEKL